jgi:SAM-dependent methyltransferase
VQRSDEPPADEAVQTSVAAYTANAREYARIHAARMGNQVARFAASLPVPSLILDAGCGPGRDLARFVSAGHLPRGLDLNHAFVEMAAKVAPTDRADLRDVASLYPERTFDGIWAAASLVHLSRPGTESVLSQFAFVVRPGGKLFACLRSEGDTGWLDEPEGTRWYTVWRPDDFATAIANAGFEIDEVASGVYVEVWATRQQSS